MALVSIPGGRFMFGLDSPELSVLEELEPEFPYFRETPAREVTVAPFRLDATPVTNAAFAAFVRRAGYRTTALWRPDAELLAGFGRVEDFVDATGQPGPSTWRDGAPLPGTEEHPVSGVSWFEARAYAASVGRRLPTEIEWEWAARGTERRIWAFGDVFDPAICPLGQGSRPVGTEPGHVSPFGVFDLGGLVAEWCSDVYRRHLPGGEPNSELERVLRADHAGGAPITVRATVRTGWSPFARKPGFGFRTAESPQPDRRLPKLR